MKELIYNNEKEIRLDHYLKEVLPHISRTKIQKLIKSGSIKVDKLIVKPSFILKNKNIIFYSEPAPMKDYGNIIPEEMKLDVIHEDEHIIVINKPSGIVVHPGAGNKDGTLINGMLYHFNKLSSVDSLRPGLIHRLDKYTSGVIVFAKTDESHYFISSQFAERKVRKNYKALVWGNLIKSNKISGYIIRDPKNRLAYTTHDNRGKLSSTTFNIIKNYNIPITMLDVFPHTGRTHQIRVHLSSIGHPIMNDDLYGGSDKKIKSFHAKYTSNFKSINKIIDRVALHASNIEFFHPLNNKKVSFEAPLPKDFLNVIKNLELL